MTIADTTASCRPDRTVPSRRSKIALKAAVMLCLAAPFLGNASGVRADIFELVPLVSLREEFNSNIFFDSTEEVDDWVTTLSPGLRISDETERFYAGASGRLDIVRFLDNDELDATQNYLSGRIRYRLTPRMDVAADAEYTKDFRPDRDILETGLVQSAQPRWRRSFNLNGSYRSSETATATLTYGFQDTDYQGQEFADSTLQTLQFAHAWNAERIFARSVARFGLGYAHGDFDTSRVDSYSATVGTNWNAFELLSVGLDVGVRYTRTDFTAADTAETIETTRDWSGIGEAVLQYRDEKTRARLALSHDIRQASGRGGTVMRTSAVYWMARRFSRRFEGRFLTGYYRNASEGGTVSVLPVDEQTVRVQSSLQYDFTRNLYLRAAYTLTWVEDSVDDTESVQNLAFALLYWQWPVFE